MQSPLHLPFSIGNDICRITRIRQILKGRLGPHFVRRILRAEETRQPATASILSCILDQKPNSNATQTLPRRVEEGDEASRRDTPGFARAVEFMAGRFAAKEAVIKAHPYRRLTFQSIAILRAAAPVFQPASSTKASMLDTNEQTTQEPTEDQEQEKSSSLSPSPPPQPRGDTSTPHSGPLVALIKAEGGYPRDTYASISISHDTDYATAVCIGVNEAPLA
ncbi:hypothetical protein F5Y19DRAFT_295728 [Xylariaceae sp. FL1651]|nr:hypothetical protein F5Y19DRAFT_295728 [Xylariaceae sp. FL1651]